MQSPPGDKLLQRLGYRFRDPLLFRQAVTHKSYVNEHPASPVGDNERMEFLGDAVLDFVITDLLVARLPHLAEGELSKLRASLVSEASLAELARGLGLGACLRMGKGESLSGGREKHSILSDALEAVIAAIYLDSRETAGVGTVFGMVARLFQERLDRVEQQEHLHDFKTALQELVQRRLKERVTYVVLGEEGPDHEKQYEVAVYIRNKEYGRGRGRSKKESEQIAARLALDALAASAPDSAENSP